MLRLPSVLRALGAALVLGALAGCSLAVAPAPAACPDPYVPGLGEIMTLQQMRHAKLWLAGSAGNWPLADYELDELGEGFADVVRFHPTHKSSPVPLSQVVPAMVDAPLAELRKAVGARDPAAFTLAYDRLTEACNDCHHATEFAFNVVRRPATNPFPNQDFAPR